MGARGALDRGRGRPPAGGSEEASGLLPRTDLLPLLLPHSTSIPNREPRPTPAPSPITPTLTLTAQAHTQ